jgi:cell division protein FtsB
MMQVHPELVHMGSTGFYEVEMPDPWKLVKAIQQLKAENDNEAAEITALRDEVPELRASFDSYQQAHP